MAERFFDKTLRRKLAALEAERAKAKAAKPPKNQSSQARPIIDELTREQADQRLTEIVRKNGGKRTVHGAVEAIELPFNDDFHKAVMLICRLLPDD